ncbi:MAG: hypothetical protein IT158_22835 [Bryobacterales bacterium]|nr:hypothetical protein [Bryobacterales bacterium]
MARTFPARLHVLLASGAPVGVVFRRGPANAVCTVGWNRGTDEFQLGQWLRGRIYERRADLSPDGRHLIYFARGGRWRQETQGSWTAISRAPWLHAVTLYGKGDCWQGGGLFTSNEKYWLNGCHFAVRQGAGPVEDREYRPEGSFGGECPSVYYRRLLRDGWSMELEAGPGRVAPCTVFTKPLPHGWILRKFAYADIRHPEGAGVYWDEHELEHAERRARLPVPSWEWAERDGAALIWAEKGVLYRAALEEAGLGTARALYDFNPMRFESRQAPY